MASKDLANGPDDPGPVQNPWPLIIAGGSVVAVAFLIARFFGDQVDVLRFGCLAVGLLATALGLVVKPKDFRVWLAAAGVTFLGAWSLYLEEDPKDWDSLRLFLIVMSLAAAGIGGLFALPQHARRIVVGVLIVAHFIGIFLAVASTPPSPFMAQQIWGRVYRPYLEFAYLNNAYHFYAPDPGPAFLVKFRIEYTDGKGNTASHWVQVPNYREDGTPDYPVALSYQRRLSLADNAVRASVPPSVIYDENGQPFDPRPIIIARREQRGFQAPSRNRKPTLTDVKEQLEKSGLLTKEEEEILKWRYGIMEFEDAVQAMLKYYKKTGKIYIAYHPVADQSQSFSFPALGARQLMSSMVRFVAKKYSSHPNPKYADFKTIKGIKVYRVVHQFLNAEEFAEGFSPDDPTTYWHYYFGEFDGSGRRIGKALKKDGKVVKDGLGEEQLEPDPLIYWLIPIFYDTTVTPLRSKKNKLAGYPLYDFVRLHAGDEKWILRPGRDPETGWEAK